MITRPTVADDVRAVLSDLSDQSKDDYCSAGASRDFVADTFVELARNNKAETAILEGKPAAILAIAREQEVMTTWFMATKAYFAAGVPALLHARRYLKKAHKIHGPLFLTTRSPRPDVERYYLALGYVRLPDAEGVEGAKVFVYK